jgi:hypothetical protein
VRLIDADALKETIEFHPTSVSVCMTVAEAKGQTEFKNRCLDDIDNAPTIDAIPVEWMEKMLEKMNHAAEPHFAFFYVLNEWQNTKSIEEQQAESEMRDWQKEQEENDE